ncbi:hypothetical protein [Pseudoalteromonas sp. T1lg23B]|nr:hypothetical protein [Pseudoalteromonas sp. T1lg23B]
MQLCSGGTPTELETILMFYLSVIQGVFSTKSHYCDFSTHLLIINVIDSA